MEFAGFCQPGERSTKVSAFENDLERDVKMYLEKFRKNVMYPMRTSPAIGMAMSVNHLINLADRTKYLVNHMVCSRYILGEIKPENRDEIIEQMSNANSELKKMRQTFTFSPRRGAEMKTLIIDVLTYYIVNMVDYVIEFLEKKEVSDVYLVNKNKDPSIAAKVPVFKNRKKFFALFLERIDHIKNDVVNEFGTAPYAMGIKMKKTKRKKKCRRKSRSVSRKKAKRRKKRGS